MWVRRSTKSKARFKVCWNDSKKSGSSFVARGDKRIGAAASLIVFSARHPPQLMVIIEPLKIAAADKIASLIKN